jgi:YVTN family beta-propeller protein
VIGIEAAVVTATVAVGPSPSGVVVTPDGRSAYVPSLSLTGGLSVVSVIDTGSNEVTARIPVGSPHSGPSGLAVTPDGRHVYVASSQGDTDGHGTVSVIETASNTVVTVISGNPFPAAVTVTPDGSFAYVLDNDGNTQVIDTATQEATFPLLEVDAHERVAFTPDGLLAYFAAENIDSVEVVEVATRRVIAAVDVFGGITTDMAAAPDGRHIYLTQRPGEAPKNKVIVIDTATQQVVGPPISWSGSANGLAIAPDGQIAYVSDQTSAAVQVVSLT